MNKYLLIGDGDGICGSTLYHEARITYLSEIGYSVFYINPSFRDNGICLSGIKECKNKINCKYILNSPWVYTSKQIDKIIYRIVEFLNVDSKKDNVFIESTSITYGLWGELIAEAIHGIHFMYVIQSHIDYRPAKIIEFAKFKYKQNLIAGMISDTIPNLIGEKLDRDTGIAACWKDPLTDDNQLVRDTKKIRKFINDNRKIIGYFGTLDKAYVPTLYKFVDEYAKQRPEEKFAFVTIGSSSKNKIEKLYDVSVIKNIIHFNIPSLYPVPREIFELMDLCIGSFGSATVAARGGAMTVRLLNDYSLVPSGIIGITLQKYPYSYANPSQENLEELLDGILFNKVYEGIEYIAPPKPKDYHYFQNKENVKMMPFEEREGCYTYFDTRRLLSYCSKFTRIKKIVYQICGLEIGDGLISSLRNIIK